MLRDGLILSLAVTADDYPQPVRRSLLTIDWTAQWYPVRSREVADGCVAGQESTAEK